MKKEFFALLVSVFMSFGLYGQAVAPVPASEFEAGVVFFRVSDSFPVEHFAVLDDYSVDESNFPQLKEVFNNYGLLNLSRPFAVFNHPVLLRIFKLNFSYANAIDKLISELESMDFIVYAEKNPLRKSSWKPNDPFYGVLDGKNMRWHLDMIHAEEAWDIQRGDAGVKVAIVDNYVWGAHDDLQIDSVNQYDAYNRKVGDASPIGFIPQNSSYNAYLSSHGTHCAGLVGAKNDNGIGIASIGGGVTLMGVRTSDQNDNMYRTAEGVAWAVSQGARVVSMSYGSTRSSQTEASVFQAYFDAGVVLVAAAGNEGDEGNPKGYPACYPSVISVASVNADKRLSYFSQHGDTCADIAAPGGFIASPTVSPNVLSTTYCTPYYFNDNNALQHSYYDGMQGTSMSCPIAAGLCGLLLSKNPNLTPAQIKYYLQKSAIPISPLSQTNIGKNGYIDALGALVVLDTNFFYAAPQVINNTAAQTIENVWVYSQNGWTLQPNYPDWILVDTINISAILTQMVLTVTENAPLFPRTGTVVLYSASLDSTITITINQEASAPRLEVDKDIVRISQEKDKTSTLSIRSNTDWTINGAIPTWLTLSDISGTGDKKVVFTATSDNTTDNPFSCTFTLEAPDVPAILLTVHQMNEILLLIVDKSYVMLAGAKGSRDTIFITSNTDWVIYNPDTAFINFNPSKGFGNQQVIVTTLSNNTLTENIQRITIVDGNGCENRSLDIVQSASPFCYLPVSAFNVGGYQGDTVGVSVYANIPWTVINSSSWVSPGATSASDSAIIIFTATQDNPSVTNTRSVNFQVRSNIALRTLRINQLPRDTIITGITDYSGSCVSISPNPSENWVMIKSENLPMKQVRVMSVEGKVLKEAVLGKQSEMALDMANFAKGIYFLQIQFTDNTRVMKKIVKK
jgi:subtilisin family serine protease